MVWYSGWRYALLIIGLSCLLGGCSRPESRMGKLLLPDDEDEVAVNVTAAGPGAPASAVITTATTAAPVVPAPVDQAPAVQSDPPGANTGPQPVSPPTVDRTNLGTPSPSGSPGSITPIKPGNSLTVVERRRHVIASLQVIAGALERYRAKNKRYPDCYYHYDDQPYLSWRVELLPFLGYAALYKKFNYREPWDSPGNRRLLAEIPPMYQSPERGDERTNFLLAVGQHTAYVSSSGPRDDAFVDGLGNTILLVEADDAYAIPWTKPDDWRVEPSEPRNGVFALREDGFFAVMGNAAVRQIPNSVTDWQLAALWTARGGEPVNLGEWSRAPVETVDEKLAATNRSVAVGGSEPSLASSATASVDAKRMPSSEVAGVANTAINASTQSLAATALRRPNLPVESEVKSAEVMIKQVYGERYSKAKTTQERREIASIMLSEAESVRHELPSYYTLLRIARDIATSTGDLTSAQSAMQKMESTFEFNVVEQRLPWLETANKHVTTANDAALLADQTSSLFEIALEQDAFDACRDMQALFLSLARRANDAKRVSDAQRLRDRLDAGRKAYAKIAGHLHALLRSPQDPQANHEVGKYLCFIKRQWDKGVPYLARGNDGPLKQAAVLELQLPATPETQANLGDTYWSLSESQHFSVDEPALRDRAAYWYRLALPQQPDGLRKSLIQERMRIAEETTAKKSRTQT